MHVEAVASEEEILLREGFVWNMWVLSQEWKSEGVIVDDENSESTD